MIIVLRVYNYEAYFCVMAERSHGKKSNRLSNTMGYEEVHIEYSTAPLLPTFPRGTPSDQPSVDSAADAAPPPPRRPTSCRRAALCEDHRSSTFAQRSREALLYSLQSLFNTLDRKDCIISDTWRIHLLKCFLPWGAFNTRYNYISALDSFHNKKCISYRNT